MNNNNLTFTTEKISVTIAATGGYVPKDVLSNATLEKVVKTNDEWIYTYAGIRGRRILEDPQKGASFLAIEATKDPLNKKGLDPKEIDLLILATATPGIPVALTGSYVASQIGATNVFALSLQVACSSFLFGVSAATKYIESGRYKKVLLVDADKMSSIIGYTDRATCVLFGDGGGAALFEPNYEGLGIKDRILKSDGIGHNHLYVRAGGSLCPTTAQTIAEKQHFVFRNGKTIFKYAMTDMADTAKGVLKRNNLTSNDVQWLTPHQANRRITDTTAECMGLPAGKVMLSIRGYGNTASATIVLALNDYEQQLKKDDNVVLAAFGDGFTWGTTYLKWAYDDA